MFVFGIFFLLHLVIELIKVQLVFCSDEQVTVEKAFYLVDSYVVIFIFSFYLLFNILPRLCNACFNILRPR
jgi:competence protein ComGC